VNSRKEIKKVKTRNVVWILGLAAAMVVAMALMASSKARALPEPGNDPPGRVELKIDNFSFGPMSLKVPAGTTVTWTNNDDVPHTVVSADKTTFRSKALDTGDSFSYTFTKPGAYPYFCSVHPKMTAEVVVQ
jgi:plastocyanin